MSREGNYRPLIESVLPFEQNVTHSKGALVLVGCLAIAITYSWTTTSDAQNSAINIFRKPYLDLKECIDSGLADDKLSALCEARDGSMWNIRQSTGTVFPSEFALAESIPEALEKQQQKDTTLAWVALNNPLVLLPSGIEECDATCVVAGTRENGITEYFAVPSDSVYVKKEINDTFYITPLQPGAATVIDKNTVSY